ncbi:MAG: alpha/beta fold hydrolase [Pseudomonadales bacterium]|nr:alpha/beta fold hydrolase [Pseudomonadales bacterium]
MPIVQSGNTEIYYEAKGQGPALILAHGAGGNAAIWFNQIAYFSQTHQVITFDHRTFGRSPVPSEQISVQDFRDDLLAIMDDLSVAAAHIVGQSMGGFTVLRTALDAPDRVLSLTLSATSGGIVNPNPSPALKNLTSSGDNNAQGVQATMSAATKDKPALMQLYESINNFNVNFSWGHLAHLLGKDSTVQLEQLADLQPPALIIAGNEDPLFPADLLSSFIPHFRNGRIEVVANSGHSPYFEQPETFNTLLEAHINQ